MNREDSLTLKLLIIGILIFFVIASILVLIFASYRLKSELGLLIGAVIAICLALHMNMVIQKSMYLERHHAAYLTGNSIGRMLVVGVLLGVAAYTNWINVITMLIGLISLKVSALLQPALKRLIYKNTK